MNTVSQLSQIAERIIKRQELIIGPFAWEEAKKVHGLVVNKDTGEVVLQNGDLGEIINHLVAQYEKIFGRASHEVCKEAVRDLVAELPPEEVPESLK